MQNWALSNVPFVYSYVAIFKPINLCIMKEMFLIS